MPEVRHSVCALDCPDACSVLVTLEDDKATRLRGNPDHPVTRGFLCGKVARYLEREYEPSRLLYPLRGGGRGARESAGIPLRNRTRTVPALQADSGLGGEYFGHQCPFVAVHCG